LRVPLDWTEKFHISELEQIDPNLSSVLLTTCLQSFYHPTEGTVTVAGIPTACSWAVHLALSSPALLATFSDGWEALFDTVVSAMVSSKQLCAESKRRFSRFYIHTKLSWHQDRPVPITLTGKNENSEDVSVKFSSYHLIYFQSQV